MDDSQWDTLVFMFIVGCIALIAAVVFPNFIRSRDGGTTTACKSNLKNLGTALEMYSTDCNGSYPDGLARLTPRYLRVVPTCATVGRDTYSANYAVSHGAGREKKAEAYTIVCAGHHHGGAGLGPNLPQYNSWQGLVER